ncbi:MAG: BACON domain-containing protein [Bryobacterales bacterium]|nr:BACON domain-containing protein [Bryobacterales bacterium]
MKRLFAFLLFVGSLTAQPVITSISPATATVGDPGFTLTVNGSGFLLYFTDPPIRIIEPKVTWITASGTRVALGTTYYGTSLLTAAVPNSVLNGAETASIQVSVGSTPLRFSNTVPITVVATPRVDSVAPVRVPSDMSFSLIVRGANFRSTPNLTRIRWNGTPVASTTYYSSSELRTSMPSGSTLGPAQVDVVTPLGGVSNAQTVTVVAPLLITSPTTLPQGAVGRSYYYQLAASGGTSPLAWSRYTSGLPGPCYALGDPGPFALSSSGAISGTASSAGTYYVCARVTDADGYSKSAQFQIAVVPAPQIMSISPSSRQVCSPEFVLTVNGLNFSSDAAVRWNSTALATTSVSSIMLTATVPAVNLTSRGTASISVAAAGGSPISNTVSFGVLGASIQSTQPTSVAARSGSFTLTVNGSDFGSADVVRWGSTALSTTFVGASQLRAAVPASLVETQGLVSITVVAPCGTVSNVQTFTVSAPSVPTISSITPTSARVCSGAVALAISGSNFVYLSVPRLGSTDLATAFQSATQLQATVPSSLLSSPGSPALVVTNPGGVTSNATSFTVTAPAMTSLSPASMIAGNGSFTLTVNGSNFVQGDTVRWNGSPLTTTFAGTSQLTASVASSLVATVGRATVTVATACGFTTSGLEFTISSLPPAVLSTVTPNSVIVCSAPTTLTLTGSAIDAGATVILGGTELAPSSAGSSQIQVVVPANLINTPGVLPISVINPGAAASNSLQFSVNGPAISNLSPGTVDAQSSAFTLTVNGQNFASGFAVRWEGTSLPTTFVSSTRLTAQVAASFVATAGHAGVSVHTPCGASSAPAQFTIATPGCVYSLSSEGASFDAGAGTGSADVSTAAGCSWSASSSAEFVAITSGASGTGPGQVRYSVAANPNSAPRTATLLIAGRNYTVSQAGSVCTAGLTPASALVGSSAGSGTVGVSMSSPSCPWSASSNSAFLTIDPPLQGTGSSTITYRYSANTGTVSRTGALTIAGLTFQVMQSPPRTCTYSLTPQRGTFPPEGGAGAFNVITPAGCAYNVSSDSGFLTVTSGGSGSGPGSVAFSVARNSGRAARTGNVSAGGMAFTVSQAGEQSTGVTCRILPVAPTTVRASGLAELVAPVEIECTGRAGSGVWTADIVITLNTNFTSRIVSPGVSDALLSIGGGGVIRGQVAGYNVVAFRSVPVSNGESEISRRFRITGVRANAAKLGEGAVGGTAITGAFQIQSAMPIGLADAVRTLALSRAAVTSRQDAPVAGPSATQRFVSVKLQELFADALKSRSEEAREANADTSTRVLVRMRSIAGGLSVWAPETSRGNTARLISADGNGTGGTPLTGEPRAGGLYRALMVSSGAAFAVYEVTSTNGSSIETLEFPILVENGTSAEVQQMVMEAVLAPRSSISVASATAPVPRFVMSEVQSAPVNLRIQATVQTAGAPPAPRVTVALGSTVTLQFTVFNDSIRPASNVLLLAAVPPGLSTPTSCVATQGACTITGNLISINLGVISGGGSGGVMITLSASGLPNCPNCLGNGSVLGNDVTASADEEDADLSDNSAGTLVDVSTNCDFTLSRSLITAGPAGVHEDVYVNTGPSCEWTVNPAEAFVTLSPLGAMKGSATVSVTVAANPNAQQRSSNPGLAGKNLRIVQAAAGCTTLLTSPTTTIPSGGGSYQAQVTTSAACPWEAATLPDWLRLTSPTSGTGSAALSFTAQPNVSSSPRTGHLEVSGESLHIVQQPAFSTMSCSYTVSPTVITAPRTSSIQTVSVTTGSDCIWTAAANSSFVGVTSGEYGTGNGSVQITVTQVDGGPRSGTLMIAGHTVTVNQTLNQDDVGGLRFVSLRPCRLMETRPEYNFEGRTGQFGPPHMAAGATRTLRVADSNVCSVPTNAKAYVLNVTLVPRGGVDFVTIWPDGETRPEFWTIRSPDGQIVANSTIVKSGNGSIQVYASNETDIIVDISGYMTDDRQVSNLAFFPMTPCRVLDSRAEYRPTPGPFGPPSLVGRAGRTFQFPATPYCQVPSGASAYSVTLTVVPSGPLQFLTAWPSGGSQPNISNINSPAGRVLANNVIIPASSNGSIDVYVFDRTDLIIDINGYFAPDNGQGLFYYPLRQCRAADTRSASGGIGGMFGSEQTRTVPLPASACGIPATARGYVVHATALPGGSPMPFLMIGPAGLPRPNASVLNAFEGQTVTNSVLVPAGANGAIDVFAYRPAHVVLDVAGYFGRQ